MQKVIIIAISLVLTILLIGCDGNGAALTNSDYDSDFDNDTTSEAFENDNCPTAEDDPTSSLDSDYEKDLDTGDFYIGKFRPLFYDMPLPFAELVGRDVFHKWLLSRSNEERENENVAVSFIKHFNISREDFTRANEELRQGWADHEASPADSSSFELYPVDLIFTFDNERINRYFLWENSPVTDEFGLGMKIGNARPLFYNMPAPFANLVGRETFIEWKHSRSPNEKANEAIAVSFIKYFNISREAFTAANEEVRQVWERQGLTAAQGSEFEVYDVDLIFSFDNERINEFFLWENSLNPQERAFGRCENR